MTTLTSFFSILTAAPSEPPVALLGVKLLFNPRMAPRHKPDTPSIGAAAHTTTAETFPRSDVLT